MSRLARIFFVVSMASVGIGATTEPPLKTAETSKVERAPTTAAAAAKASVALPLGPRFKQVRERLDALFAHRNAPPEPPHPRANPFRPPGPPPPPPGAAGSQTADKKRPDRDEVPTDLSLLQRGAATLKVSGIFEIAGKSHLVINARPYKEGDVVQTQVQGEAVYIRVKTIAKRSVVLTLNEAEMTLKF